MRYIVPIFFFITVQFIIAQPKYDFSKTKSDYVLTKNKEKRKAAIDEKLNDFLNKTIEKTNEEELTAFLYEADLIKLRTSEYKDLISLLIKDFEKLSRKTRIQLLESIHTSFENEFNSKIESLYLNENDDYTFVLTSYYLLKNNVLNRVEILKRIDSRNQPSNGELITYYKQFLNTGQIEPPNLSELFKYNFHPGKTIIYTFFRRDRNFKGLTIVRKPDGSFVKNADESIFSVPQLGLSVNNLPGFLRNGNTPAGIYSIVGWYITPTKSIGPTPIVLTRLPFEVSTDVFYHRKNINQKFALEEYLNLLPKSWQAYDRMREAYYAGKLGRKLIIMHGSADDLEYFDKEIYYPLTPSKGCLTTKEIWNNEDGTLIESDQVKLMNAFFSTRKLKGYLLVVELDDAKKDVSLEEIETFMTN